MMPCLIVDRAACRAFTGATGVAKARFSTTAVDAPVAAFPLGDQRLPGFVKGTHLEPARDRHAPTLKGEIAGFAAGHFNELIDTVEGQGLAEALSAEILRGDEHRNEKCHRANRNQKHPHPRITAVCY